MYKYTPAKILNTLTVLFFLLPFSVAHSATERSIQFIFPTQAIETHVLEISGDTAGSALEAIAIKIGVPKEYLLLYRANSHKTVAGEGFLVSKLQDESRRLNEEDVLTDDDATIHVFVRPVTGDHVHSLYSIWVHDGNDYQLVRPLFDDELMKTIPAEGGDTAYYFAKLHNGLHTHGKGLIHVHPWTSPKWLYETDGLGATLYHWFDTVGVTIRQPPYRKALSLQFSNGLYFIDMQDFESILKNKDHHVTTKSYGKKHTSSKIENTADNHWQALYWKHHLDFTQEKAPDAITSTNIGNVWLGRNLSIVVLIYGPKTDVVEGANSYKKTIKNKSLRNNIAKLTTMKLQNMKDSGKYFMLQQFDGEQYPSPHSADNRYKKEDAKYRPTGGAL